MADTPEAPNAGSSPWVGSTGFPDHPTSPMGGGGPGNFVTGNRIAGAPGNDAGAVPHPLSPLGRNHLLVQNDVNALHDEGVQLDTNVTITGGPKKPNPPPVTKVRTIKGAKRSTANEVIEVTISVAADLKNSGEVSANGAGLKVGWDGEDIQPLPIVTDGKMATGYEAGPGTKISWKRTVKLQIHYGSDAKPDDLSAYGRGTTDTDVSNNDTSIGFHESCHLDAAIAFFQDDSKLPAEFTGKFKTMTGEAFMAAQKKWLDSFDAYLAKEKTSSMATVDEVGKKYSAYKKANPNDQH